MKIIEAVPMTVYIIKTDREEFNQYIRYDSDTWFMTMGESDEPMYDDCKEIEKLFQEFIKSKE